MFVVHLDFVTAGNRRLKRNAVVLDVIFTHILDMISVNVLTNIRACSNRALTYFDLRIGLMILILDHQTFQVRKNGGSVSYEAFWGMGISLP